ncbi:MAG: TIGR02266 family protein [Thermoanaerobaculales bacterium]|jgi:uncharacterized protein (TIGR02266 family)|nr:TIGR02266 family protein [Thermoanaerobaculales bacterium]
MTDDLRGVGDRGAGDGDLIELDLNFESMRRFQAEFSPNLSADGLFIDTGEPLPPGAVVRFRVILPEGFVLLEGTAVVEWNRQADAVTDGPPGMALRFVTLSPQNQELVEQLVQDHLDAGGVPFNLDVRPAPADFPTDALEGAPDSGVDNLDEGYRLTIRRAGIGDDAEALRALAAAMPTEIVHTPPSDSGEGQEAAEPHGFEILTAPRWTEVEPPAVDGEVQPGEAEAGGPDQPLIAEPVAVGIGDPPELDWADDEPSSAVRRAVEVEPPAAEMFPPPVWRPSAPGWAPRSAAGAEPPSPHSGSAHSDVLPTPVEFDGGPEVIGEIGGELGSPAFDVSLPEPDDGADSTPVMPDEGRDEITVPEDDDRSPDGRRRRWPWAVAALFLVALAGGLLWPGIRDRLEPRTPPPSTIPASAAANPDDVAPTVATEPVEVADQATGGAPATTGESAPGGELTDLEAGESRPEVSSGEPAEEPQGSDAETGEAPAETAAPPAEPPTPAPAMPPADAIVSIEVTAGSGGAIVEIRGNGSLGDGAVSVEPLTSPPRLLVRLRGIASPYRPYTLGSTAPEVSGLRIGHHAERRPPELWVVVDLADAGAVARTIDIGGDRVRLDIGRP